MKQNWAKYMTGKKRYALLRALFHKELVRLERFELPSSGVGNRRSIPLSYSRCIGLSTLIVECIRFGRAIKRKLAHAPFFG